MQFPRYRSDRYPFPSEQQGLPEQWDATARLLRGAETVRLVDQPVRGMGETPQLGLRGHQAIDPIPNVPNMNSVRYAVIAENLFLLGYLKSKLKGKDRDIQASKAFQRAVATFQEEAAAVVDGWVGHQTWTALQALVSFESNTQIDRWFSADGSYSRAFSRAIHLRLWAYGLVEKRPSGKFKSVHRANIEKLKKLLWALGAIDSYEHPMDDRKLFTLLFDSDHLLDCAAQDVEQEEDIQSYSREALERREHRGIEDLLRRFLVNLAKVELWLLGSDIKIDGKDNYPVSGLKPKRVRQTVGHSRVRRLKVVTSANVRKHLEEYWSRVLQVSDRLGQVDTASITPQLFHSLLHPEEYSADVKSQFDEEDYSREVADRFQAAPDTPGQIKASYSHGRSLGMKLWDGLKRLWRWFKRGVKRIVEFAGNALRAFYRFALKSFAIVKTAFRAFALSLSQYLDGKLAIENPNVTIFMRRDFDKVAYTTHLASLEDIHQAMRAEQRFSAMFNLSCAILGTVVELLKSALGGLVGWVRMLMVLVKAYRDIAPAYRELAKLIAQPA